MPRAARSYLYVPGDQPDKLAKAAGLGADALILDLEDAVVPAAKQAARERVGALLRAGPGGPAWWVRVNADTVADDVAGVMAPGLSGVVLPKAEPASLTRLDRALTETETTCELPLGSVGVLALIETARGLVAAEQVATGPRVLRIGLGEADLAGELGLQPGPDREELWPLRSRIVVASAAAEILPPVGPVETAVHDADRMLRTTQLLLRQGFRARTAIHPAQVPVIHQVFSPSLDELAAARDVLARLSAEQARGSGVALTAEGRLIDEAVARSARDIVGRSD